MKGALLSAVGVAVALVLQLTLVNRLPLPGGSPDLVLVVVVALGLCGSPAAGALTGFLAGLSLDLAPPASYLIGLYALVFCVVGYCCGRSRVAAGRSALASIVAAAVAAGAGEVLYAVLGLLLGDPQVTWSAVRQVVPAAAAYDAALSPFVLFLVIRAVSWAGVLALAGSQPGSQLASSVAPARARAGGAPPGGAGRLGGAGLLGGAAWLAGPLGSPAGRRGGGGRGGGGRGGGGRGGRPGRVPRLREGAGRSGDGWVGGGPRSWRAAAGSGRGARPPRLRPPRLRPAGGRAGSAVAASRQAPSQRSVQLKLGAGRRRDGVVGTALGATLRGALNGSAGHATRRAGTGPAGSAFRGAGSRPGGSPFRGAGSGQAFRSAGSGPAGSAFRRAGPGPAGSAFRKAGPGQAFRGAGSGPAGSAFRRSRPGPAGSAFLRGARPGAGRPSALAGSGTPARSPRFRPDGLLRGGSAQGLQRRSRLAAPTGLRLRAPRRGDGVVGGLMPAGRRFGHRPRPAVPRFRARSAGPGAPLATARGRSRSGKQARFRSGRRSLLAVWSRGRLGGRSKVWRIGSKRNGRME